MRAFYSSQMPGKNKGRDCGRAVTSYMLCHENCVTEVQVPKIGDSSRIFPYFFGSWI